MLETAGHSPPSQEKAGESGPLEKQLEASIQPVPQEVVDQLAAGCVNAFVPGLSRAQEHFQEVLHNQEMLLEKIHETTESFADRPEVEEIVAVLAQAPMYRDKLLSVGQEMHTLLNRVRRLKQRAEKLQQHKQKQEISEAEALERQRQREKHLEAKTVNMSDP